MKNLIILFALLAASLGVNAQNCTVLINNLQGSYTGDCRSGRAHGQGVAVGTDRYEGQFKNGLPDGEGTMTYANGDIFTGMFVKGQRQGKGTIMSKNANQTYTTKDGYWDKDQYVGEWKSPFEILNRSSQVARSTVSLNNNSTSKEIMLLLSNTTGNQVQLNGGIAGRALLTELRVAEGSYKGLQEAYETTKQKAYRIENVSFPFRASFMFGSQRVEVAFYKPGSYTLDVNLNN